MVCKESGHILPHKASDITYLETTRRQMIIPLVTLLEIYVYYESLFHHIVYINEG